MSKAFPQRGKGRILMLGSLGKVRQGWALPFSFFLGQRVFFPGWLLFPAHGGRVGEKTAGGVINEV